MSSVTSDRMFRSAIGSVVTDYQVSFTGTSGLLGGGSPTLLVKGAVYRFVATEACHIAFHATSGSATATTSKFMLPPFTVQYLTMPSDLYCAVIQNSAAGSLIVTKMGESGLL